AVAGSRAVVVRRVEARQPVATLVVCGAGLSGARAGGGLARAGSRAGRDRAREPAAAIRGARAGRPLRLAGDGRLAGLVPGIADAALRAAIAVARAARQIRLAHAGVRRARIGGAPVAASAARRGLTGIPRVGWAAVRAGAAVVRRWAARGARR